MTAETPIVAAARILASKLGHRLFRNNNGVAKWPDGRMTRYGLGTGTSDLIGWRSMTITPEMVGKKIAQFTAVEIKGKGTATTDEQIQFIETVCHAGGLAGIARSAKEVEILLNSPK